MNRFTSLAFASLLVTAAAAQSAPNGSSGENAAGPRDKMVCKRFLRTGTLASFYRTCKPKWEWERERENLRQLHVSDSCARRGEAPGRCPA